MAYFADNALTVGNTPMVRLNACMDGAKATVLAKIESRNPAGSVKCRLGLALIEDARSRGLLTEGVELIEPTSGNTGLALAFVAAVQKIPLTLVMPDNMTVERRKLLGFYGAKLILTPAETGMKGSIDKASEIVAASEGRMVMLQQFKNPANPNVHEMTTGPEIWSETQGNIDILVAGAGTGGTITGITRFIKKTCNRPILSIAVEPVESAVISQALAGRPLTPSMHKIQGIGAGFIPETLDLSILDGAETVTYEESLVMARRLAKEEGILSGLSGGANVAAAVRLAQSPEHAGKTIVTLIPDSAERYLSTDLFAL